LSIATRWLRRQESTVAGPLEVDIGTGSLRST